MGGAFAEQQTAVARALHRKKLGTGFLTFGIPQAAGHLTLNVADQLQVAAFFHDDEQIHEHARVRLGLTRGSPALPEADQAGKDDATNGADDIR